MMKPDPTSPLLQNTKLMDRTIVESLLQDDANKTKSQLAAEGRTLEDVWQSVAGLCLSVTRT